MRELEYWICAMRSQHLLLWYWLKKVQTQIFIGAEEGNCVKLCSGFQMLQEDREVSKESGYECCREY